MHYNKTLRAICDVTLSDKLSFNMFSCFFGPRPGPATPRVFAYSVAANGHPDNRLVAYDEKSARSLLQHLNLRLSEHPTLSIPLYSKGVTVSTLTPEQATVLMTALDLFFLNLDGELDDVEDDDAAVLRFYWRAA